jgi:formimidoylglutamate deiminase
MTTSFDIHGRLITDDDGLAPFATDALVLPGFVNAHSHAFQRALRGRVEHRPAAATGAEGTSDDFWSWRTAMYADAARVSPDDVEALATWAYADMLRAGFTTVGEFHYLHHDVNGAPYAQPEMSLALARAARTVGIRLVLLETAYARGGCNTPLSPTQRRFAFLSHESFVAHLEKVRAALGNSTSSGTPLVHVGVAVHSVRACPRQWIEATARHASSERLPLHVHACEQRKELAECRNEHGLSPIELLMETGALTPGTTVVHATHVAASDIAHLKDVDALVCLTPSTERNLGDGLAPTLDMHTAGVHVCIGTDSHARIDVADELRSVEEHERLRTERRNVLLGAGQRLHHALIPCGARNGLRSLMLLDTVDVMHDRVAVAMPLEGKAGGPSAGLDAWLVGGAGCSVRKVRVGQRIVVDEGELVSADQGAIDDRALAVLRKLSDVSGCGRGP